MAKNTRRLDAWSLETTYRTPVTPAFYYGESKDDVDMPIPSFEDLIDSYTSYDQRMTSGLIISKRNFLAHTLPYYPTDGHFLSRMLGLVTSGSPNIISEKKTGLKKSFTHRWENINGTNPTRIQCGGCYTTQMHIVITQDMRMEVEETFNWSTLQDHGDVSAISEPIYQEIVNKPYNGIYEFLIGETEDKSLWKADILIEQEISISPSKDGLSAYLYPGKFKPIQVTLIGYPEDNTFFDAARDRTQLDLKIRVNKVHDATKYIQFVLDDCYNVKNNINCKLLGVSQNIATLLCPSITANWIYEGSNLATYYPYS